MSTFSEFVKLAAPVVATISPEPISRATAQAITVNEQRKQASYERNLARDQQAERNRSMAQFYDQRGGGFVDTTVGAPSTAGSGFMGDFGNFLTDVGTNIVRPVSNLFSSFGNNSVVQQPAVTTTRGAGAQETQGSGSLTSQASFGNVGRIFDTVSKVLKTPGGGFGLGGLLGLAPDLIGGIGGAPQGRRITRKMKSQARMIVNMTGGNLSAAADILGISQDQLVFILLKRFRNDGAVVTKAALRKTKQTVRRLKSMCDMYDSLRPTATRRKTPMRRASTTLISNK